MTSHLDPQEQFTLDAHSPVSYPLHPRGSSASMTPSVLQQAARQEFKYSWIQRSEPIPIPYMGSCLTPMLVQSPMPTERSGSILLCAW